MPATVITPVLTLDESRISSYDPQDPADLSLLWSAFSKTSHVVYQGERLRNFSWRLWNRERLFSGRNAQSSRLSSSARQSTVSASPSSLPQLSTSVESDSTSTTEDEQNDSTAATSTSSIAIRGDRNSSKERHITPLTLRNMIHSIQQPREFPRPIAREADASRLPPANLPRASSPRMLATESTSSTVATAVTDSFASTGAQSDTSASSNASSQHSIVRGFTPGTNGVTSYTSKIHTAPPQPILKKPSPDLDGLPKRKTNGMFMLGCSSGSAEEGHMRGSLLASSLRSSGPAARPCSQPKKTTSFQDEVAVMKPHAMEDAAVFDDSDEEDCSDSEVSDSAIEDDDDAWEDEGSESQEAEKKDEEMKFYRVDSSAHLPSRKSALTLDLQGQRNGGRSTSGFRATPAYKRSRNSTPNGPSMPGSPEQESPLEVRSRQMSASKPIIPTTTNTQPLAPLTSPRTTRRQMIDGELSVSLRKNILSERSQQRNPLQTNNNQIRRAHTAFDVSRLSKLPEGGEYQKSADSKNISNRTDQSKNWNHYFDHTVGEFNQAGW